MMSPNRSSSMVPMTTLPAEPEHVDVLIVGAGISGIGAARHLEHRLPGTLYAILEARDAIGGTWGLFRYPGTPPDHRRPGPPSAPLGARAAIGGPWALSRSPATRSPPALPPSGYAFKPWTQEGAIAAGAAILRYIPERAAERGIDRHIRFGHRV